jgi:Arc/MetJ family transcription regulator
MKLTLNIDDDLLERVREMTGAKTKTEAIHYALGEIDRRNRLRTLLSEDIGLTPAEWRNAYEEPAAEEETLRVAEEPAATARREPKPRSRR